MTRNPISFLFPRFLAGTLVFIGGIVCAEKREVSFNFEIRPIMSDTCFVCHGPDEAAREADLRLDIREAAIADRDGSPAIIPGNAEDSLLTWMINAEDEEDIMPPPSHPRALTEEEKELFRLWIEQGAHYEQHWSLILPEAEVPKVVSNPSGLRNPIDAFVLNRLNEEGLKPSPEADRTTLLRRVTFDLTGLPPTLEEIDGFLADDRPDAYERLVDHLLGRITFAERMTNEWLDVARFADTQGYSQDFVRDMSPWRDWVIEAFHENMPFDQFVEWQLAGDLLQGAKRTQKLATGFLRLHPQNAEGGIVNEEFLVEYAAERVQTLGAAFMGMTMECARCHDHKYDPISQENFYELFSFFNNIDESGQISFEQGDMPVPTLMLPTEEESRMLKELDEQIAAQLKDLEGLRETTFSEFQAWKKDVACLDLVNQVHARRVAHFPLGGEDSTAMIANSLDPDGSGRVLFAAQLKEENGPDLVHVIYEGSDGFELNGDDPLYFPTVNFFRRAKPFSVGIRAWLPEKLQEGTLFHFNKAGILYNYKGFEVSLLDGHWEVRMAHTFPYNAIQLVSEERAVRKTWQHVMLSYDGSSKASGLTLYVDGRPVSMRVLRDNLYKNILSNKEGVRKEIGLKVGARWRSKGLPGVRVDEVEVYDEELTSIEVLALAGNENPTVEDDQRFQVFLNSYHAGYQTALKELADLRQRRNELNETVQEVMVMDELDEPRQAFLLRRGAYDSPIKAVEPDTPEAILPFDVDLPKNRRGLAKWLTDPQHPLTARVTVNRYWQMLFGRGIVGTPEDFGNQGQLPTHPKLLDWLAREFIDSGWDVKRLISLMVTSSTYRQSSKASPALRDLDPENLLLARGPSSRLSAEMLRDNALAASGLLVRKVGGKSVYPYQPEGLWKMNKGTYKQGTGEDLYRRSMYTVWKRTVPPPTMNNFDAPTRSYCVVKRQQTSSPLQALTLMNDPQFVEASRVLAQRVMCMSLESDERLILAYRLLTTREPNNKELGLLREILAKLTMSFSQKPAKAESLLSVGETEVDPGLNESTLAAYTLVVSMIMNHDAATVIR